MNYLMLTMAGIALAASVLECRWKLAAVNAACALAWIYLTIQGIYV